MYMNLLYTKSYDNPVTRADDTPYVLFIFLQTNQEKQISLAQSSPKRKCPSYEWCHSDHTPVVSFIFFGT